MHLTVGLGRWERAHPAYGFDVLSLLCSPFVRPLRSASLCILHDNTCVCAQFCVCLVCGRKWPGHVRDVVPTHMWVDSNVAGILHTYLWLRAHKLEHIAFRMHISRRHSILLWFMLFLATYLLCLLAGTQKCKGCVCLSVRSMRE